jgi:asparagine synthase (glutamine-hydrolysing)
MDAVIAHCNLEAWRVKGDDAWPLANPAVLSRNPSTPEQNPYREIKNRAYRRSASGGSRVALSGGSGDIFSSGTEGWFRDLLRAGRLLEAGISMVAGIRNRGLYAALREAGFGAPLRPIRARLRPPTRTAPWLTDFARDRSDWAKPDGCERSLFPRPAQYDAVVGAREARGISAEIYDASRSGIDLRHPYRDRRLTEFMLAVPAHQLYRQGRYKHLARVASAGVLPSEIPARTEPTLLTPLFRRGIFEREGRTVRNILHSNHAVWPRFVDPRYVEEVLRNGPRRPLDEVVLWHCIGFETWIARHGWAAASRLGETRSVFLRESAA